MLKTSSRVPELTKYEINGLYSDFIKSSNIPQEEFMDNVNELRPYKYDFNHFVVEYATHKNDKRLVKFFLKNRIGTVDHCDAVDNGGKDTMGNILIMCAKCNQDKASFPYLEFLKVHPDMENNTQKQIKTVISAIKQGILVGWDDYPELIKRNLSRISDSVVNIDINQFQLYRKQKLEERINELEQKVAKESELITRLNEAFKKAELIIKEHNIIIEELKLQRSRVVSDYLVIKNDPAKSTEANVMYENLTEINEKMREELEYVEEFKNGIKTVRERQLTQNDSAYKAYQELLKLKKELTKLLAQIDKEQNLS